jgi:CheY-like chemotaxis protein
VSSPTQLRTWAEPAAFADGRWTAATSARRRAGGDVTRPEAEIAAGTAAAPATGVARVLVVDDEPAIRTLLRLVLARDERFDLVGESVDATDAIARAREVSPDVILLDLLMPGQHGRDALPALRAAAPDAMILVLSSLSAVDEEKAALEAGAFGYLEKSVLGPRLPDVVSDHLARFGGAGR